VSRRIRFLRAAVVAATVTLAPMAAAHADPFADVAVADDAELADARGAFITAGGVTFDLGAVISTWRNGALALQTVLNWTPTGVTIAHSTGAPAPSDVIVPGMPALTANGGVAITDPGGATTVLHMTGDGQFINSVITSQSDQLIRQDIALAITLPGFDALQAGFMTDKIGIRLNMELNDLLAAGR
jgi:hypothetical protein